MECEALFEVWGDRILKDYLWAIAGSFAHGNQGRQVALYTEAWCKISWCEYGTDIAFLMDAGFTLMERFAWKQGWCRQECPRSWMGPYRAAKRRLRFFLKRCQVEAQSMV